MKDRFANIILESWRIWRSELPSRRCSRTNLQLSLKSQITHLRILKMKSDSLRPREMLI